MLFKWLMTRYRRNAYRSHRNALEAEFHKNTHNTFNRVMLGLALITEPLEYNGDEYIPLKLHGTLTLSIRSFDVLHERLWFFLQEYTRVTTTLSNDKRWINLSEHLSRKGEQNEPKWLDQYFGTSDETVVRKKLLAVYTLIQNHAPAFDCQNAEQDALHNQSAHIFRELETVVEHYL